MRSLAGPQYTLRNWPADALPDFRSGDLGAPRLLCFSMAGCRAFAAKPLTQIGHLELVPKMLLLDENAGQAELEEALEFGVSDIIRPPLTKKRLAVCLRRAAEAAALHRDIQNMTREIFLDRELLERKNETLRFLVNFLTRTSEPFDEAEILARAYASLQSLFPVLSMHAVLCSESDNGDVLADLYVSLPDKHPEKSDWRDLLLESANAAFPGKSVHPSTTYLQLPGASGGAPSSGAEHLLTLSLTAGSETIGMLLLATSMERNLGRDQAMALDSALRHLALCLKNARRFQQVCRYAESDSLTGVYNRRHFEQTLNQEVERHRRYKQDISLIMLDVDHFKKINDTWGHQAGDTVLRGIAETIVDAVRQTDYCARYGGEEFVILLPHTNRDSALLLADRLRQNIEKRQFSCGGKGFSVTASLGVACLVPQDLMQAAHLTREADMALYLAKGRGRNRVVAGPSEGAASAAAI